MAEEFLERLRASFPDIAAKLGDGRAFALDQVDPPASDDDLAELEEELGVPLPESNEQLLRCSRSFSLGGGVVQFGFEHPFFHEFKPFEQLMPREQRALGGPYGWPPPSQGMLCFAECFLEASVRRMADTFPEFLSGLLDVLAAANEED